MQVQTQHRFNVKEYYRMAETGVLRPDARVELLNGEIIDSSPVTPLHAATKRWLSNHSLMRAMIVDSSSLSRWNSTTYNMRVLYSVHF